MKTIILICVILIIFTIIFLIIALRKTDNKTEKIEENKCENKDLYNMKNLNDNIFVAKKVQNSKIIIPDFDKNNPIGYKDKSNLGNNVKDKPKENEKFKRRDNY